MSGHRYVCVGGPLDGKEVSVLDGRDWFDAPEKPEPARFAFFSDDNAAPVNDTVRVYRYVLQDHRVHGTAWVVRP